MPRGFVWGLYIGDNGAEYALKVDADYAGAVERGWIVTDPATTAQFPRGWLPRAAFGYDETGNRQFAVVASVNAPLWTGQAEVFTITGNDAAQHAVNVVGLISEKRLPRTI